MDPEPSPPPLRQLDWQVEHLRVSAGDFHRTDPPPDGKHRLWWVTPPRPALILGSTQPESLIDRARAEADGVEVTSRRSGGGIVYVDPSTDCWIDVIVPRHSPLWDDDVGRAFHWLGRVWADVIGHTVQTTEPELRLSSPAGPPQRPAKRPLWCFGEVGQGEVTLGGYKVVGLSQRRTRHWTRLQGLVLGRWPDRRLRDYVRPPTDTDTRFDRWDPTKVLAGPPPGLQFPSPGMVGRNFVDRFVEASANYQKRNGEH